MKSQQAINKAYAAELNQVGLSVARLQKLVNAHAGLEAKNYGHIGDLAHLNDILDEAIEFMEKE